MSDLVGELDPIMTDLSQKMSAFPVLPLVTEGKPERSLMGRARARGRRTAASRSAAEDPAAQSRFVAAATQLHDEGTETRMAGVQALVTLADEDTTLRQKCISLLCTAFRARPVPYPEDQPEPDEDQLRAYCADRKLRRAIVSAIATRLRPDAPISWRGCDLDFTGAVFDEDRSPMTTARPDSANAAAAEQPDSADAAAAEQPDSADAGGQQPDNRWPNSRAALRPSPLSTETPSPVPPRTVPPATLPTAQRPAAESRYPRASPTTRTPGPASVSWARGSPGARSASPGHGSQAARPTSPEPGSPAARSASPGPSSPTARSASPEPGSPARP